MEVIYEYAEESKVCVLRTDNYVKRLSHFMGLFHIAKEDFPELNIEDVTVEKYGGDRHKRQNGIEFKVEEEPPEKYTRIGVLELTI